eukprot:5413950-Amphidinium_carterae.1
MNAKHGNFVLMSKFVKPRTLQTSASSVKNITKSCLEAEACNSHVHWKSTCVHEAGAHFCRGSTICCCALNQSSKLSSCICEKCIVVKRVA